MYGKETKHNELELINILDARMRLLERTERDKEYVDSVYYFHKVIEEKQLIAIEEYSEG